MNVNEAIEKMNKLHKVSKSLLVTVGVVWGVGIFGILGSAVIAPESIVPFLFFVWIFGGNFYVFFVLAPKTKTAEEEMKILYKDTFLNGMFNEFFDHAHYMGQFGFTQYKVGEFDLYQFGNRFESEDQLSGEYKGVHFEQADVRIWKHIDSNGSGSSENIEYFKGRMFIFDIQIKNVDSIKIFNKLPMNTKRDYRIRGSEDKRVKMESMEFNDAFTVYSEDAHDAFYVLTPTMMEKLMDIYHKYCKITEYSFHDISFHFKDGKLYFAMECFGNAFDPGEFPISYPEEKAKLKEDIQVIIELIECLDLIDKDALVEKEEQKSVKDYWSTLGQQNESGYDTDVDDMNVASDEEKSKPYTRGLKLKL